MWDILRANVFTPLNFLITVLAVVLIFAGQSPINMLFFIAMVLNSCIGVWQEVHARRVLNKLRILNAPKAKVSRGGKNLLVDVSEIRGGDIIELAQGDQILVDGLVVATSGLEVDESLLTGEADSIVKNRHNRVLSGSVVVAGSGTIRATSAGDESYAAKLSKDVKRYQRASSELVDATNKILKFISVAMLAVLPIIIVGQLKVPNISWQSAVTRAVAAVIGMIPEGLVLLTSANFALSAVKLARRHVLIQQLPAVETLARVDTIFLDKTGTITNGETRLKKVIQLGKDATEVDDVLETMTWTGRSSTERAIRDGLTGAKKLKATASVPFNSARKWSATLINGKCYYLGAPEILLSNTKDASLTKKISDEERQGNRVLALCLASSLAGRDLPNNLRPIALVVLAESIRPDAAETLRYFRENDVDIRIISGDSVETVGRIAAKVGVKGVSLDASQLKDLDDEKSKSLLASHKIVGRISPRQKNLAVEALREKGHVVAMVGDGVNDIMAIKKADIGIAMRSGASATRQAAEVVLMDDNFGDLPAVLAEGRRVTANIERVASLFLVKNVYSLVLALATSLWGAPYPLLPAQMTVISGLTIGIPALILSLPPNNRRYQPGFLRRVLTFSIPTGVITATVMSLCYYFAHSLGYDTAMSGTIVACAAMVMGLIDIAIMSRPMKWWKCLLIIVLAAAFCAFLFIPPLARLFRFTFISP